MIYYGGNDYRDYLAHHGIVGMRWGIRRYQPYPGDYRGDGKFIGKKTASETADAVVKEFERRQKRNERNADRVRKKTAKSIRKQTETYVAKIDVDKNGKIVPANRTTANYKQEKLEKREDVKKLHDQLAGARDEMYKSMKEIHDYTTLSQKKKDKYIRMASDAAHKQYGQDPNDKEERESYFYGYKYDDLDQGSGNSFEMYCKANKIDYNKVLVKANKAEKQYTKTAHKAVSKWLGKYGDEPLSKTTKTSDTVNDAVTKALEELEVDERIKRNYFFYA